MTDGRAVRTLFLGTKLDVKQAYKMDIIQNIYKSDDDLKQ